MGVAIKKPKPSLDSCVAKEYFFECSKDFSEFCKIFMVDFLRYFSGCLSISAIEFATGVDANNITPKLLKLEDKDFAQAYCLFSRSVFGVAKIANGLIKVDRVSDTPAENRVPLLLASNNPFLSKRFWYILCFGNIFTQLLHYTNNKK